MRVRLVSCVFALMATACMHDKVAPPDESPDVVVFEAGPQVAQCAPVAVTLQQSAARLSGAGVEVRRSSCGFIEDVFYPAVCGAGTGQILLHDIPAEALAAAEAAGFAPADSLGSWRRDACPQHLHAIEMAQQTTSCADIRNRVMHIQDVLVADRRMILLDQAGNCSDAGYRQILFGEDGNNELCSFMESIAGPQKSCPLPAFAMIFDTILANLNLPDLGLGYGYAVSQVYPGTDP